MPTQNTSSLQDKFLKYLRDKRSEVTIFLANGIRLQGQISSFDNFTIQLVRGKVHRLSTSMLSRQSSQQNPSNW